jgi:photosystem II stability/assembly factor-like uncharacterized protein
MRRSFLKHIAAYACAGALPSLSLLARSASAAPAASSFDVLTRPALPTPKATGAAMLAVARAGKRLIAVGERGIVLLSDDDAVTWRQAQVPVSVTLTGVQFVNERLGWAIGHLGVVLHTDDGGATWIRQLDGLQAAAIALQAAQEAAAADPADAERELAAAQYLVDDGPDKPLLDLYFHNERTGFVVGAYNLAFRTDDGGSTWKSWMGHIANPRGMHLYAIEPVGGHIYLAGEQGLLLRSSDGGESFTPVASPSKGTFFGLVAGANGELLVYGLRGRAFWSGDAGAGWTEVNTGTRTSISAGARLADGRVLIASQVGELVQSRDNGRSFEPVTHSDPLPVTGLAQSANGGLVLASPRGMHKLRLASAAA